MRRNLELKFNSNLGIFYPEGEITYRDLETDHIIHNGKTYSSSTVVLKKRTIGIEEASEQLIDESYCLDLINGSDKEYKISWGCENFCMYETNTDIVRAVAGAILWDSEIAKQFKIIDVSFHRQSHPVEILSKYKGGYEMICNLFSYPSGNVFNVHYNLDDVLDADNFLIQEKTKSIIKRIKNGESINFPSYPQVFDYDLGENWHKKERETLKNLLLKKYCNFP